METLFAIFILVFYACVFVCIMLEVYTMFNSIAVSEAYEKVHSKDKSINKSDRDKLISRLYGFYTIVVLIGCFVSSNLSAAIFLFLIIIGSGKYMILPKSVLTNVGFMVADSIVCAIALSYTMFLFLS